MPFFLIISNEKMLKLEIPRTWFVDSYIIYICYLVILSIHHLIISGNFMFH